MKKTALLLMLITIISKFLGFGREIVLSYFFGASNISDAYLISWTIPGVVFSFVGVGIATSFIPIFSAADNKNKESGVSFVNNIINVLLLLVTFIVILVMIFTPQVVKSFATGFDAETSKLAILFTRISIFSIYFSGLIYIFSSFLQIRGNYLIPALMGIPLNVTIVVSIILGSKIDITILAVGILFAKIIEFIFLLPSIRKQNYKHKMIIDLHDEKLKKMITLALPVILGVSVNQINTLVDRTIASSIAVGGISALNYANKINGFVQGVFITSFITVLYPMISRMVASNNISGMKKSIKEAIVSISLLVVPAALGSMLFSKPLIELLFGRGEFDSKAIMLTSSALLFYSLGMIGFGLREVLSRAFYSIQDTKTPVINAAIGMIVNIVLNIILSRYLGIGGLALATSIAALFTTFLLFVSLRKKIGPLGMKQISISFLKILFASLVMGGLAKLSFNYLTATLSQNLSLLIAIGVGALSYFVIIYFMKIEDVDVIVEAIKKKLGRGAA